MHATLLRLRITQWLRLATWRLLILALVAGSVGQAAPAAAVDEFVRDHRDPDARVWLLVRKIIVHDDFDWGDGEINIRIFVRTNTTPCGDYDGPGCGRLLVESAIPQFTASDNTTKQVNRYVPSYLDSIVDRDTSPDIGIPIHLGDWYRVSFVGTEIDPVDDDDLGRLFVPLIDDKGQVRYGTFTERANGGCQHLPGPLADFCPPDAAADGGYSVEYEIRPAPLPDLRPIGIKLLNAPGTTDKLACVVVQNIGERDAGPFVAALQLDGAPLPKGRMSAGGLARGQSGELCVQTPLPSAGTHRLAAIVDEADAVVEVSETNNRHEQPYAMALVVDDPGPLNLPTNGKAEEPVASPSPTPASPSPTPEPARRADQADLSVGAIKVNGQVPDGKADCRDGKNAVTVLVKNVGEADAGRFAARLVVDGAEDGAVEQSVGGLDAGREREIRFDNVRLKKGEHTLTVSLDPKHAEAEAADENNSQTVTVACQGAN